MESGEGDIFRVILLTLFEQLRIRSFHHWKVLSIHKPIEVRHGTETLELGYRLAMSRMPQNYRENISSIEKPTYVLVGGNDELFHPEQFKFLFANNHHAISKVIPEHNHDGILFSQSSIVKFYYLG